MKAKKKAPAVNKLQKQVDKWYDSLKEYRRRSEAAAALDWALRRMEFHSFEPLTTRNMTDVLSWLYNERNEHCRRVREQAEAQAKIVSTDLVKSTPAAPQVADDTPLMIDRAIEAIKPIAVAKRETAIQAIQGMLEARRLSVREHLQMMIEECQIGLEKIKLLICREKPRWGQAGDILMPMWKALIEEGLKHEICMNFKPDPDGPKEQFGGDITLDDLYVETRAEREARERAETTRRRR